MSNCSWAAAVCVLLAAASAGAQTAKPETAPDAAAAAASAAMERARRQAAGPMRVILEASKARRKPGEPDAQPTPPPPPQPAEAGSVRVIASRSAGPLAALTPPPAAAVPAAAVPSPVATQGATQMTLNSEALQGKAASAVVPGLETLPAAALAAPVPAGSLALPTISSGPARVKLISRVDPDVAQRQLDDMGRNAIVMVDLTIRADGTVGAVNLVPPTPRGIQRALVVALEQWRFEALPSERVHRVQLVFNGEP